MATLRDEDTVETFTYAAPGPPRPALRVRVERPPGTEVTAHAPLTWSDGQIVTEVSFACESGPLAITVTQCNVSSSPAPASPPALEFTSQDRLVWWLGGVTNYVAHADAAGRLQAFWPYGAQWRAVALSDGVRVEAAQPRILEPGQQQFAVWRHGWFTCLEEFHARLAPAWYPAHPVVEAEDEITLQNLDGVVHGPGVNVFLDHPNQLLSAAGGIRPVTVIQPEGASTLPLGWARPLHDLVLDALCSHLLPDISAWLMAWVAARNEVSLDELDIAVADGLIKPTPFAVAAAADAAPLLGRALLADAAEALGRILQTPPLPDGVFLAGVRLYAQALAAESAVADDVLAALWSPHGHPSVEAQLLTDPDAAGVHAPALAAAIGNGLPGHVPSGCARDVALLKVALAGNLTPAEMSRYAQLHIAAERWLRAGDLSPEQLAWLLW
ncbi:MAG: hypothetical protein Q3997_02625 [Propionibacteriaceae bacterium]|nr:hypothetical protein [Propionibacteriaceae bacterium]